jgi:hypothetical protein
MWRGRTRIRCVSVGSSQNALACDRNTASSASGASHSQSGNVTGDGWRWADDDADDDDDEDDAAAAAADEDDGTGNAAGIGGKSGHASTCGKCNRPPAGGDASCSVTPSCGA